MRAWWDVMATTRLARSRAAATTRPLPGGRALVGGFLVMAAIVGLTTVATAGPRLTGFVVSSIDGVLPAGHVVRGSDVVLAALALPPATASRAHREAADVVGRVLLAPLGPREIVQRSAVGPPGGGPGELLVAVQLDEARSGGSAIGPGDVATAFSTPPDPARGGTTAPIVRGVRVAARSPGPRPVLTLLVPNEAAAQALVQAAAAASLWLARSLPAPSQGRP